MSPKDPKDPKQNFLQQPSLHVERIAHAVIGAAIEVHRQLGPGYLEVIYERAMMIELRERGLEFQHQVTAGVLYRGEPVGDQRIDLLVEGLLVVELKAVERVGPIHVAQLLSYLHACNLDLGLVINFSGPTLKEGIRRVIR